MTPEPFVENYPLPPGGMPALRRMFQKEGFVTVNMAAFEDGFRVMIDAESLGNLGASGTRALIELMEYEADSVEDPAAFRYESDRDGGMRLLADPELFHDLPARVAYIMSMGGIEPGVIDARQADLKHMADFMSDVLDLERPALEVLESASIYEDLVQYGYPGVEPIEPWNADYDGADYSP